MATPPTHVEALEEDIQRQDTAIQVLGGFVSGALVFVIGFSLVFLKASLLRKPVLELTDYVMFVFVATIVLTMACAVSIETLQYIVLGITIGLIMSIASNKKLFRLVKPI